MKDFYAVLQVSPDSTRQDIQSSYRRLAKKFHPDVNKSADAHEKFCEITEAYEFIMDHWTLQGNIKADEQAGDKKYTTHRDPADYEEFKKEVHERAQQQAKMRYEKFKQQHEAFQTSGINDIALLLKISVRLIGIPLLLFLFFLPLVMAIQYRWINLALILVTWPFAGIIGWYIYDNRKNYLMPGHFYYSAERIRHLFTDVHPATQSCYFCPDKPADSVPYKVELYKLIDVKISTDGFRQHNFHYSNKNLSLLIPRSRKAFIIHTISSLIKVMALICCLLLFPVSSIVWRFIFGMITGGILSTLVFLISGTKSKVSYVISYGLIIRMIVWVFCIVLVSRFSIKPFDINTTDIIQFVVTVICIFDCLLMQLLDMILRRKAFLPVSRQYPELIQKMETGFMVYNDIPVISVISPLFKWFLG
jgi:hypothetical protein